MEFIDRCWCGLFCSWTSMHSAVKTIYVCCSLSVSMRHLLLLTTSKKQKQQSLHRICASRCCGISFDTFPHDAWRQCSQVFFVRKRSKSSSFFSHFAKGWLVSESIFRLAPTCSIQYWKLFLCFLFLGDNIPGCCYYQRYQNRKICETSQSEFII